MTLRQRSVNFLLALLEPVLQIPVLRSQCHRLRCPTEGDDYSTADEQDIDLVHAL